MKLVEGTHFSVLSCRIISGTITSGMTKQQVKRIGIKIAKYIAFTAKIQGISRGALPKRGALRWPLRLLCCVDLSSRSRRCKRCEALAEISY